MTATWTWIFQTMNSVLYHCASMLPYFTNHSYELVNSATLLVFEIEYIDSSIDDAKDISLESGRQPVIYVNSWIKSTVVCHHRHQRPDWPLDHRIALFQPLR